MDPIKQTFDPVIQNFPDLLSGLGTTLQLTLISGAIALVAGVIVAVMRVAPFAPLRWLGTAYVEFVRNVPLLAHMFFWVFGLGFLGITLPEFVGAFCGLGFYTAAFVAEAVRAGILAVGRGQIEAARSLGLSYAQMMRLILLPQAITVVVPPLGNLFIAMTKNTSVAAAVTVPDLLFQAQVVEARTFATYAVFLTTGALYLSLTLPLGGLVNLLERRMTRFRIAARL
jgi:putative glutamine transport system permease protein